MPNNIQLKGRETGGAGKPAAAGVSRELAVNFSGGAAATELWGYSTNIADWVLLNPKGASPQVRGVASGVDQGSVFATFNNDAITVAAGDIVIYTYNGTAYVYTGTVGAPVAGSTAGNFTRLGAAPAYATQADITTGTGIASATTPKAVKDYIDALGIKAFTAGAPGQGKLVRTSSTTGKIEADLLGIKVGTYRGAVDPTATTTVATPVNSDWVSFNKAGTLHATFTGAAGETVTADDIMLFDGTNWHVSPAATDLSAYLKLSGGSMTATAKVTFAPTVAATTIIDGTTAANAVIDNVTVDGGTY